MLELMPISLAAANGFVAEHHRHHKPVRGHKFSLGCMVDGRLVGVAIVGRPVSRYLDDGLTLEVNRTCIAGDVPNGNSMLYSACWRATKALGYRRLITYTQQGESGASLRGAGWRVVAELAPRSGWDAPSRRRESKGADNVPRYLWEAI